MVSSSHSHSRVTRDGVASLGERGENSEESGEEHVGDVVGFWCWDKKSGWVGVGRLTVLCVVMNRVVEWIDL